MRALAGLLPALMLALTLAGPARAQDFSITNPQAPTDPGLRNIMPQLQAWWDIHAYYPRGASENDEAGTVRLRLVVLDDGRIRSVHLARSSGSRSLDSAAQRTFAGGFVKPFPGGKAETEVTLALHYVLAHRHGETVPADYVPEAQRNPFTITNIPVKAAILTRMRQKLCTGLLKINGLRNHPIRGIFYDSTLIFFQKPDGSEWVKFTEVSRDSISPVVQIGNLVSWTGPRLGKSKELSSNHYTAWLDADNKLNGCVSSDEEWSLSAGCDNAPGTLEFTCADTPEPPVQFSNWDVIREPPPDEPP